MSSSDDAIQTPSTNRRGASRFKSMRSGKSGPTSGGTASSKPKLALSTENSVNKGNSSSAALKANQAAALRGLANRRPATKTLAESDSDDDFGTSSKLMSKKQQQQQQESSLKKSFEDLNGSTSELKIQKTNRDKDRKEKESREERQERKEKHDAKKALKLAQQQALAAANQAINTHNSNQSISRSPNTSNQTLNKYKSHSSSTHSINHQNLNPQNQIISETTTYQNDDKISQTSKSSSTHQNTNLEKSKREIQKLQAKIQELESDLKDRGDQVLKLRKDNRALQSNLDEANDSIQSEKQSHEKILLQVQDRTKRQIDAAKREGKSQVEELQETINDLSQKLNKTDGNNNRYKEEMLKYKSELEKTKERLQTTTSQLADMTSQVQRLSETALAREKDNKDKLFQQAQTNVESEEKIQNCEAENYNLRLELDQAKNDTKSVQSEVNRLREQVTELTDSNDDLKAQLLKANITRARELAQRVHTQSNPSNSLAAEIDTADRSCNTSLEAKERKTLEDNFNQKIDKLQKELTASKAEHDDLKIYLDKIIMSIMEKDPSILEVK